MHAARSPEELELLLEDAFLTEDEDALVELFAPGAVLGNATEEARGEAQIGRLAGAVWRRGGGYEPGPLRVLEAHGTALVVGPGAVSVARRRRDGEWRYTISLLNEGGRACRTRCTLEPETERHAGGSARSPSSR